MSDDDWDETPYTEEQVDPGRSFGRGRGFVPDMGDNRPMNNKFNNRNYNNDENNGNGYECGRFGDADEREDSRDGFRGRGRGGRGRGRGRGRGGSSFGNEGGRGFRKEDGSGDREGREFKTNDGDPDKPKPERYIPPDPNDDEDTMFGGGITSGINFDKYDNIRVEVTGADIPEAITNFQSSGLRKFVLDNVFKSGYKKPTPVQKHALPIIMAGRDLMACAQTGSGKTAAFLLPIIHTLLEDPRDPTVTGDHCEPHAIIVSPTRELTLQIFNEARKFSHNSIVKTVVAYGGTAVFHQVQQVMRGCHILVATPGRLLDFVNRGRITFNSVRFVVLDEADRMLDMGFLGDIEKMMGHPTMVESTERQTLMFSATFPEEIQRLATQFLNNYLFLAVGIVGGACADVEQKFHMVSKFNKRSKLTDLLTEEGGDKILVFVEMKRTADFIAAFLSEQNFPTTSIHGDRQQREREEALADFKSGRMKVLVATAVAARGLDIKNVSHVVNYDLPKSIDEYVHRIGRTGRVGNRGKATSFYDSETDAALARDLLKILKQANQEIPDFIESDAAGGGFGIGGGGGGGFKPGRFGGKDFRKFDKGGNSEEGNGGDGFSNNGNYQAAEVQDEDEEW